MSKWDLETWLKVAATVLQAISVAVAAFFAILGLNAWRRQLIGKRKVEIAEEALLARLQGAGYARLHPQPCCARLRGLHPNTAR
jgi:hypothetical protein